MAKQQKAAEKKKAKQQKKIDQSIAKAKKQHLKNQSKNTRKMMRKSHHTSKRWNEDKKGFFLHGGSERKITDLTQCFINHLHFILIQL